MPLDDESPTESRGPRTTRRQTLGAAGLLSSLSRVYDRTSLTGRSRWQEASPNVALPDLVIHRDSETVYADTPAGRITSGGNAADVINEGIDQLQANRGTEVLIKPGGYPLTSQVTVPPGIRLTCAEGAGFSNSLKDEFTPCLFFDRKSAAGRIFVDANEQNGVKVGQEGENNSIDIEYMDVVRAGTAVDGENRQVALDVRGYNVNWNHVHIVGGHRGIDLTLASDLYGHSAIIVDSEVGMHLRGCEHVFLDDCDFDSCRERSLVVENSRDVRVSGSAWFNATKFETTPTYGTVVGAEEPVELLRADMTHVGHDGTGVYIDRASQSRLNVLVSNTRLWTDTGTIETGIETTENTADSVYVTGIVGSDISEPLAVEGGTFDLPGTE